MPACPRGLCCSARMRVEVSSGALAAFSFVLCTNCLNMPVVVPTFILSGARLTFGQLSPLCKAVRHLGFLPSFFDLSFANSSVSLLFLHLLQIFSTLSISL